MWDKMSITSVTTIILAHRVCSSVNSTLFHPLSQTLSHLCLSQYKLWKEEEFSNKTAQQAGHGDEMCTQKLSDLWSGCLQRDSVHFQKVWWQINYFQMPVLKVMPVRDEIFCGSQWNVKKNKDNEVSFYKAILKDCFLFCYGLSTFSVSEFFIFLFLLKDKQE